MTVADLLSDVYEDCWHTSSPDATIVARIRKNLGKAHKLILRDPSCARLRDTGESSLTLTSESGRAVYGLPSALYDFTHITDQASQRELILISLGELRALDPGRATSGTPYRVARLGTKIMQRPFAAAGSGLWAASSAAGDTTQVVRINAVQASGIMTGDLTATLTGLTRVAIGSTLTDLVELQHASLSAACVGVVSLYDAAAAGNVIAQIGIGQKSPQYCVVELYPTPSAAVTYYIDGPLRIPDLDNAQEVPLLPEEFHDLLGTYARMREYEKGKDDRLPVAQNEWKTGFEQLRWKMNSGNTGSLNPHPRRYSRFGPNTPAETWR